MIFYVDFHVRHVQERVLDHDALDDGLDLLKVWEDRHEYENNGRGIIHGNVVVHVYRGKVQPFSLMSVLDLQSEQLVL